MAHQLRSGDGWRVGWNPDAAAFQALLGADDWAVELTQPEFDEFCRLAQQLSAALVEIRPELMAEEAIACEASSDLLWMEVRGLPDAFSLSFILLTGRRAEGIWSAAATPNILRTVQMLRVY